MKPIRFKPFSLAGVAVCALSLTHQIPAAILTWDGSNGNWDTDANWLSDGTEPIATDDVNIDSGTVSVTMLGEVADDVDIRDGTLNIQTGGDLTTDTLDIGRGSGSNGVVNVNGPGAILTARFLDVGDSGTGTLNIQNGGAVTSTANATISGVSSIATVTGAGSTWTSSGLFYVDATLNIENGGVVSTNSGATNRSTKIRNTATVTGAGSQWNEAVDLVVGSLGTSGTLNIENAAAVTANRNTVVGEFTDNGIINFNGGTLNASGLLASPDDLTGTGTINANGLVSDINLTFNAVTGPQQQIIFNSLPGQNVTINLDASNPASLGTLGAGYRGAGTLTISDGQTVYSGGGVLGLHSGSTGTATITGAGSTWINSGSLAIGPSGVGSLNIDSGGVVTVTQDTQVGSLDTGGTGTINFSGGTLNTGGLIAIPAELTGTGTINASSIVGDVDLTFDAVSGLQEQIVLNNLPGQNITLNIDASNPANTGAWGFGYQGSGSLTVADGLSIASGTGTLGHAAGSTGVATITGTGSAWNNSDQLSIGLEGEGTLNILSGASVTSNGGLIGESTGSSGTVHVTGNDSEWINSGNLLLGLGGEASLTVSGGAEVSNTFGSVMGTSGVATVTGGGSTWINTGDLIVGLRDNFVFPPNIDTAGTLNIEDGGNVFSARGIIGERNSNIDATHSGAAVVTGTGSTWTNTAELFVGSRGGIGTLTIEDGGVVSNTDGYLSGTSSAVTVTGLNSSWINSGDLFIARANGGMSNGTLDILAGASVSNITGHIGSRSNSIGVVTVTGTGSTWTNHADLIIGDIADGTLRVEDGGLVTSVNGEIGAFRIIGTFASGLAEVSDPGSMWNLSGSLYVGGSATTAYAPGVLDVTDTGQVNVTDTLKVWQFGAVQGDSTLSATILLNDGTVAPGNPTGTLSLTGEYEQESGGTLEINLLSDGLSGIDFGHLDVTGGVTLNGELQVIAAGGFTPGITGSLDILTSTGTITGVFSSVALPTIPGLLFDVSYATNAVTLTINLEGDLDGDGFVGINDLNIVLANWNQNVPPANPLADPSGDGFVGIDDLNAVMGNWNAGTPPQLPGANIPEPGSSLLFLGLYGLALARRDSR